MFVDFFAGEAFLYRVVELEDLARLVVDSSRRRRPQGSTPAKAGYTVLVELSPHARISDPLIVSGYSRNREAANTII